MKAVIRTVAFCALAAAACGDLDTNDDRGYTKAPLEHPTLRIRGEQPTEMALLREPLTPTIYEVPMPDTTPAQEAPEQPSGEPAPTVELPEGVTQEMVAAGEQVFSGAGFCFTCHGANGGGTPLAPALNDGDWLHIDGSYDEILRIVHEGEQQPAQYPAAMPPMGGAQLTEQQIREVAAYVYTLSH